jgi:3-hydroxy-D-aspartate aldolase
MTDWSRYDVGYDIPAKPGMTLAEVQTPALLLDLDALERNLRKMGRFVAAQGIALRPHGKMHKSVDVARLQHDIGGATGICCQKLSEAEAFLRGGIDDILITNQIRDAAKIDRLCRLIATGARVSVCVDDLSNVAELSAAASRHGVSIPCLVELDCGASRCGVATPTEAVQLAHGLRSEPNLRFSGLQAYHGGAQHLKSHAARQAETERVLAMVQSTLRLLKEVGLPAKTVSGGGTGSYRFEAGSGLFTELQCGSYAFMDADYGRLTDAVGKRLDDGEWANALYVLAEVISAGKPGRAVCDAGLKALAVDSGLPLVAGTTGLTYVSASDEHGNILDPNDTLRARDRLKLVPGHCDPTCNLHDWYVGLRGEVVETLWSVSARGKVF